MTHRILKKVKFRFLSQLPRTFGTSLGTGLTVGLVLGGLASAVGTWGLKALFQRSAFKTEDSKALYALGYAQARALEHLQLDPMKSFLSSREAEKYKANLELDREYIRDYVKNGGFRSISGLGFKVISSGSKTKPTTKDWAEVSFRGTLIDGKVIDATRGSEKAQFPMGGVIPGWTEGLQMIGEGGEIEMVVPTELAYGETRSESGVPAGSTLVFRVRLHKVIASGKS